MARPHRGDAGLERFSLLSIAVTLVAYRLVFAIVPSRGMDASFELGPAGLVQLFLIILPIISRIEKTAPLPNSITEAVTGQPAVSATGSLAPAAA